MKTNAGLIYTELFEHNLGIAIGLSQRCEVSIQLTYMVQIKSPRFIYI